MLKMQTKKRQRIVSLTLSLFLVFGGLTITALLIIASMGPGFPKSEVTKDVIIVYSSVSFLSCGLLGIIACYFGHKSWLYGLHISLEVLFLLFAAIGYMTFHTSMKIYFRSDCEPMNTTCICKGTDLKAPCDVVFKQEDLVAIINILEVISCIVLFLDLIISTYLSFCFQSPVLPGKVPGISITEEKPCVEARSIYVISEETAV